MRYLSGLSMSAIGKIVGATAQFDKFITEKPDISGVKEVEMDEMYQQVMDMKNY